MFSTIRSIFWISKWIKVLPKFQQVQAIKETNMLSNQRIPRGTCFVFRHADKSNVTGLPLMPTATSHVLQLQMHKMSQRQKLWFIPSNVANMLFSLKHYKNHSFSWMTHSTMQLVGLHWVFWQEYGLFSTKETYGGWKQQRAITGLQVGLKYEVDRDFIYIRPCTSITDIKVFHLTQSFTKNCN